jgi:C-terminal processing protease CtpA/Prc
MSNTMRILRLAPACLLLVAAGMASRAALDAVRVKPAAIEQAKRLILDNYVDAQDAETLESAAIDGMADTLPDRYSSYLRPSRPHEQAVSGEAKVLRRGRDKPPWFERGGKRFVVLRLDGFYAGSSDAFAADAAEVRQADPAGIVLDLRGNNGGLLTEAAKVAGAWVGKRLFMRLSSHHGPAPPWMADGDGWFAGTPTAVLVDGDTASAAEALAACLRDHLGSPVVGTHTFGKNLVTNSFPLSNGGSLLLVTHRWQSPSFVSAAPSGLKPDVPLADASGTVGVEAALSALWSD